MTDAEHTPGPFHCSGSIYEGYAAAVVGPEKDGLETLAHVRKFKDALLFAASAELLAVCEEFMSTLGPGGYHPSAGAPATERMRAAIAKARFGMRDVGSSGK